MEHLRLLGVSDDGSRLLLEGPDGSPYELALDERVHAALRGDRARLGQLQIQLENQLTPREIQARIRAGQTSEEIAISAQVPVERVRRFEGPVLLERAHVADLAQRTNVRRVTDASAHPLEDVVVERLEARGVDPDDVTWDARKREDGRWAVRLDYSHGGRVRSATWLFDHHRRTLEPHDAEAEWLIGDERAVPEPSRRGRRRTAVTDSAGTDRATDPPAAAPSASLRPEGGAPYLAAVPDADSDTDMDTDLDDDSPEPVDERAEATAWLDAEAGEPVLDPDVDSSPDRAPDWVDDSVEDAADDGRHLDEPDEAVDVAPDVEEADHPLRPTTTRKPARSSRRAAVPSWDEILFGSSGRGPED